MASLGALQTVHAAHFLDLSEAGNTNLDWVLGYMTRLMQ